MTATHTNTKRETGAKLFNSPIAWFSAFYVADTLLMMAMWNWESNPLLTPLGYSNAVMLKLLILVGVLATISVASFEDTPGYRMVVWLWAVGYLLVLVTNIAGILWVTHVA